MNFIEELKWRGMIHSMIPGTDELLGSGDMVTAYVGIDPTADSLHIGHLCGVMMLRHFQRAGHKPLALVGGATGMIGDPSGKSQERNLLNEETLRHNQEAIKAQLSRFLDFNSDAPNKAELVNNYDWMKDFSFLDFAREVGKHITVNYMMAKDSVIRRTDGGEAFALTCPLITKADGGKFGKTESGNVWLDAARTSPYKFYQFWLNVGDVDAEKYLKIFTFLTQEEIAALVKEHEADPGLRPLQKRLAKEVTVMVHGEEAYAAAVEASKILFSNQAREALMHLDEQTLLDIFEGVPRFDIDAARLSAGIPVLDLLAVDTKVFSSKGEARKMIQGNGLSINKEKYTDPNGTIDDSSLIGGKYILVQRGKKNYYLLTVK